MERGGGERLDFNETTEQPLASQEVQTHLPDVVERSATAPGAEIGPAPQTDLTVEQPLPPFKPEKGINQFAAEDLTQEVPVDDISRFEDRVLGSMQHD